VTRWRRRCSRRRVRTRNLQPCRGDQHPQSAAVGDFNGTSPANIGTYNMSTAPPRRPRPGVHRQRRAERLQPVRWRTQLAELVYLGFNASGIGTYNMSGGTLSATGETVGNDGTGTFNQFGGSNSVGFGGVNVASNPGSTGAYNLFGGTLTGPVINNGTFHQTFGTYGPGVFTNNANFTYDGPAPPRHLRPRRRRLSHRLRTLRCQKRHHRPRRLAQRPRRRSISGDGAIGVDVEGGTST